MGCAAQKCNSTARFNYSYSVVWEGEFTGCKWSIGTCTPPMEGEDCIKVQCNDGFVVCPPNCAHYVLLVGITFPCVAVILPCVGAAGGLCIGGKSALTENRDCVCVDVFMSWLVAACCRGRQVP